MEQQSDIGERERRTIVAEQRDDNPKSFEIRLEDEDHLWIKTPHGDVVLFMSSTYKTVTSWVDNVYYTGFYTTKTTKKTCGKGLKGVNHVTLNPQ